MTDGPTLPPPTAPPEPTGEPAETKRAWWKKWWVIAIAAVVVLMVLGAIVRGGDEEGADEDASTEPAATAATQTTDGPVVTEAPATTPAPTDPPTTPAPTAPPTTPAPTAPPTTAPPFVAQGQGDSVQQITVPDGSTVGIVTLSHTGSSNFAVWALDASLEQTDLLVNEIGAYQGTVLLSSEGTTALEITADGAWTLEVKPLNAAQPWEGSVTGRGDNVLLYVGETGVAAITHTGESNFSIWNYLLESGSADLLVNEIGPYTGSIRFPGPALIEVNADGDWSVTIS